MPNTLQEFLTASTQKAAEELIAAFLRIPQDRRAWSPEQTARTALDQMAECALLNGATADLIRTRIWPESSFEDYLRAKAALSALDWEKVHARLQENTRNVIAAIGAVPDEALNAEVAMPWGKQTLAEIVAYPYWNMTYHQGQINYIASLLGCLS